jgi:N-terminal acetyltransferase B complex non-catalytic subunit
MIVDPIADRVSKNSAQAWLDQNLDSTYEKEVEGGEFYATAKIIQGVSAFEDDLQSRLSDRLREIAGLGSASAPATRGVLHSLYVAYDVGTTILRLNAYLTRTKPETKLQASFGLAEQLVKAVIQKATMIKQSLDEGGWIDKVLKSVFQGDIDVAADSLSIPGTLKGVVDENFMEEWAGQVVDSWKDSVKGFAYFRS